MKNKCQTGVTKNTKKKHLKSIKHRKPISGHNNNNRNKHKNSTSSNIIKLFNIGKKFTKNSNSDVNNNTNGPISNDNMIKYGSRMNSVNANDVNRSNNNNNNNKVKQSSICNDINKKQQQFTNNSDNNKHENGSKLFSNKNIHNTKDIKNSILKSPKNINNKHTDINSDKRKNRNASKRANINSRQLKDNAGKRTNIINDDIKPRHNDNINNKQTAATTSNNLNNKINHNRIENQNNNINKNDNNNKHCLENRTTKKQQTPQQQKHQDLTTTTTTTKRKFNWHEETGKQKSKRFKKDKSETNDNNSNSDEIWFDDVDEILIESNRDHNINHNDSNKTINNNNNKVTSTTTIIQKHPNVSLLTKHSPTCKITKVLGMDCEMVGVGRHGVDSILARVSLVNQYGQCVYDKFVKPTERVTDYRTNVSGVRPCHLEKGTDFKQVQREVYDLIKDKILVGHAIEHDLKVLFLDHPRKMIRDTSRFKPFRAVTGGGVPSLKKLSEKLLGIVIQDGEHDSIQDAQATMRLYTLHRKRWEQSLSEKQFRAKKITKKKKSVEKAGLSNEQILSELRDIDF